MSTNRQIRGRKTRGRNRRASPDGVVVRSTSPFGPDFFQSQLGILVRERCPEGAGALPQVTLHLASGESLEVAYVLTLALDWVALGIADGDSGRVRTELVPYESIFRVTIRPSAPDGRHIGFEPRLATLLGQNGNGTRAANPQPPPQGEETRRST